jgi:hypothetical protein
VQLLLVYGTWLGSALSGWFHFIWWLAVPPIAYMIFAFGTTARMERHKRAYGDTSGNFSKMMFMPSIILILRNTLINGAIFAIVWVASSFLSGN